METAGRRAALVLTEKHGADRDTGKQAGVRSAPHLFFPGARLVRHQGAGSARVCFAALVDRLTTLALRSPSDGLRS